MHEAHSDRTAVIMVHGVGGCRPGALVDLVGEEGEPWLGELTTPAGIDDIATAPGAGEIRTDDQGNLFIEYIWHRLREKTLIGGILDFLETVYERFVAVVGLVLELPRLGEVALQPAPGERQDRTSDVVQTLSYYFRHFNLGLRLPYNLFSIGLLLLTILFPALDPQVGEFIAVGGLVVMLIPFMTFQSHFAFDRSEVMAGRHLANNPWGRGGSRRLLIVLYMLGPLMYVILRVVFGLSIVLSWQIGLTLTFLPTLLSYMAIAIISGPAAWRDRKAKDHSWIWENVFFVTSFSFLTQGISYAVIWTLLTSLYAAEFAGGETLLGENMERLPLLQPLIVVGALLALGTAAVLARYFLDERRTRRTLEGRAAGADGGLVHYGFNATRRLATVLLTACAFCLILPILGGLVPFLDVLIVGQHLDFYSPAEQFVNATADALAGWFAANRLMLSLSSISLIAAALTLAWFLHDIVEIARDILWYLGNRSARDGSSLFAWKCVGNLLGLIDRLREQGFHRILLVAHSQGTTVVLDTLREAHRMGGGLKGCDVRMVTVGSPLLHIYSRYFPDFMYPHLFRLPPDCDHWRNHCYWGDFIGTPLRWHGEGEVADVPIDRARGHSGYWGDPIVAESIREIMAESAQSGT